MQTVKNTMQMYIYITASLIQKILSLYNDYLLYFNNKDILMSDSLEAKSLTSAVNFECVCELTPSAASIKSTMPSDSLTADVTSSEKFTWPEEEYESLIICFCIAVCKYTVYLYFYNLCQLLHREDGERAGSTWRVHDVEEVGFAPWVR